MDTPPNGVPEARVDPGSRFSRSCAQERVVRRYGRLQCAIMDVVVQRDWVRLRSAALAQRGNQTSAAPAQRRPGVATASAAPAAASAAANLASAVANVAAAAEAAKAAAAGGRGGVTTAVRLLEMGVAQQLEPAVSDQAERWRRGLHE